MIVYDTSERERIEILNKFHSNMRDVETSSNIIVERNEDWKTMYFIYEKPNNYWYSYFNFFITGESTHPMIGKVEIYGNASVKIDIFKNNEVFERMAQYLDRGGFRVTVVDKTLKPF